MPDKPYIFCVPYIGPTTNSIYAGKHYRLRMQDKENCGWCMASVMNSIPVFTDPVEIWFYPHIGKRRGYYDCGNYSYMAKMMEDWLVKSGKIPKDNPKWVKAWHLMAPVRVKQSKNYMMIKITKWEESA